MTFRDRTVEKEYYEAHLIIVADPTQILILLQTDLCMMYSE